MTLGQKIKKARSESNLTQKELADTLGVTFQTVSKWENDTTEPDLATLRMLAKTLGCSLEYLVQEDEEDENSPLPPPPEEENNPLPEPEENPLPPIIPIVPPTPPEPHVIGRCVDCGNEIIEGSPVHNVERRSALGIKEIVTVCEDCFRKTEEEIQRRTRELEEANKPKPKVQKGGFFHKITDRNDRKPLIWAIVLGIIALITTLVVCIVNYSQVGLGWTIGAPLIAGYTVMATIYCIFTMSYVSDIFMGVAGWSIRFPGLIFGWSLDGIMWLIAMKILFFLLGIFISITTFLFAVILSAFFSIFTFIPLLIYNKSHYE